MDTIVLRVLISAVMDTASCYYDDISILADVEIIINAVVYAGFRDYYRNEVRTVEIDKAKVTSMSLVLKDIKPFVNLIVPECPTSGSVPSSACHMP